MEGRAASDYSSNCDIRKKRNAAEPLEGACDDFVCVVGMGGSISKFHDGVRS